MSDNNTNRLSQLLQREVPTIFPVSAVMLIVIIAAIASFLAIIRQPALLDEDGQVFTFDQPEQVHSIADVAIDPTFFRVFPEFMTLAQEKHWWSMHKAVYNAVKSAPQVAVVVGERRFLLQVAYPGKDFLSRKVLLIYMAALLYTVFGISLYFRHNNHYNLYVVLYLFAGSVFVTVVCALSWRVLTLPPIEMRILMTCLFASLIGHLVSLQVAMYFPNKKTLFKRDTRNGFRCAHVIATILIILYCFDIVPFSLMPILGMAIVLGTEISFVHSYLIEKDRFIKNQVLYLALALLSAGAFYNYFFVPDATFQPALTGFTNYALILLGYYFVLISCSENVTFYRKQLAIENRASQEKEQFRQEFHDSMLNRLANISLLSELSLENMGTDIDDLRSKLHAIKKQASGYSQHARGLLWVTDDSCKNWGDLIAQLRRYGYDLVGDYPLTFELNKVAENKTAPTPDLLIKVCLYQTLVEALSNALKHARANKISVEIKIHADSVTLSIVDDGCGFDTSINPPGHYGLLHMQRRVSELKGSVSIQSQPETGTCVTVELPLNLQAQP